MRFLKVKRKIVDKILVWLLKFFILLIICSWGIAYLPHYEKEIYEQTEPVTWDKLEQMRKLLEERKTSDRVRLTGVAEMMYSGYPTEGMYTELESYNQLTEVKWEAICLEINAENLQPTGIYKMARRMEIESTGASVSSKWSPGSSTLHTTSSVTTYTDSYIKTLLNRRKAIYAQFYVLTLEDGNNVLVLLNDTAVDIPRTGKFQLPLAIKRYLTIEDEIEDVAEKYGLVVDSYNDTYYLDASIGWADGYFELDDLNGKRPVIVMLSCFIGIVGIIATLVTAVLLPPKEEEEKE